MNAKTEYRMLEWFIVFLLLSGNTACAAVNVPLPANEIDMLAHGSTLWGITQALRGELFTGILKFPSSEQFMVFWRGCVAGKDILSQDVLSGTYNFVLIDARIKAPLYWHEVMGQVAPAPKVGELVTFAKEAGWKLVDPKDTTVLLPLAKAVDEAVKAANAALWSNPLIVLSIMPAEGFDIPSSFIPCEAAECEDY